MEPERTVSFELLAQAAALAARLEDEGRLNQAKLLRAAIESLITQAAHHRPAPAEFAPEFLQTAAALKAAGLPARLAAAFDSGAAALNEGRLAFYDEVPDPFVCRTCGHAELGQPAAPCPTCGADPDSFKRFGGVFWLEAFDPFEALAHLRSTPGKVAALLKGRDEAVLNREPAGQGWSLRQAVAHLRDAEGVLQFRVRLMLAQDDPVLESQAVFEWAGRAEERPPTTQEVFEAYRSTRAETLAILENIPLKDWWRTGRHQEFGRLTITQQASYFAAHELIHLPQLSQLVGL